MARRTRADSWLSLGALAPYCLCRWTPFSYEEMCKMMGIMIRNGLHPVPNQALLFADPSMSFSWGDNRVRYLLDRKYKRWQELRAFLHVQQPGEPPEPDPLYRIRPLDIKVRQASQSLFDVGRNASIDEQTVGYGGAPPGVTRCGRYKREGNGFQCDALADSDTGYTYSWLWRHDKTPVCHRGFAPLHQRCLWLQEQLRFKGHCLHQDNLYIGEKYTRATGYRGHMVGGTCRPNRMPAEAKIDIGKGEKELEERKGEWKIAATPDGILALTIVDAKAFSLMTSIAGEVSIIQKQRMVWSTALNQKVQIIFPRFSIVDNYNYGMDGDDVADQNRNHYRIDGGWFRNRKPWLALFDWELGIAITNAFILYKAVCRRDGVAAMAHAHFLDLLARQLCHQTGVIRPVRTTLEQLRRRRSSEGSASSAAEGGGGVDYHAMSTGSKKRAAPKKDGATGGKKKPRGFTFNRLTPNTINLIPRNDLSILHIMINLPKSRGVCQWCYYNDVQAIEAGASTLKRPREPRVHIACVVCKVKFCNADCWNDWHGITVPPTVVRQVTEV